MVVRRFVSKVVVVLLTVIIGVVRRMVTWLRFMVSVRLLLVRLGTQLNHATIRVGIKRFQSVTWFGSCSYRKFKSERVKCENLCPACDGEMVKSYHVGKRRIVKDIGSADYVPLFVDDEFDVSGEPNYVDVVGGRFG